MVTRIAMLVVCFSVAPIPSVLAQQFAEHHDYEHERSRLIRRMRHWQSVLGQRHSRQRLRDDYFDLGLLWGTGIELTDSSIAKGAYLVKLPNGESVTVTVRPLKNSPATRGMRPRDYHSVHLLMQRIDRPLRAIHIDSLQIANRELTQQIVAVRTSCERMSRAVLSRDAASLQREFSFFDEHWHALAGKLEPVANRIPRIRRLVGAVEQADCSLHQVVKLPELPTYDRMQVACLTYSVTAALRNAVAQLKSGTAWSTSDRTIVRNAERVAHHARDMYLSVQENAGYYEVLEEYRQFDEAWHRLVERSQKLPRLGSLLRRLERSVAPLDFELFHSLKVEPPVWDDKYQTRYLCESISRSTEYLASLLREDFGRDQSRLCDAADQFAALAEQLHQGVISSRKPRDYQQLLTSCQGSCQRIGSYLNRQPDDRWSNHQTLIRQIDGNLKSLAGSNDIPSTAQFIPGAVQFLAFRPVSRDPRPTVRWRSIRGAAGYELRGYLRDFGRQVITARIAEEGSLPAFRPREPLPRAGTYQIFVRAVDRNGERGPWGKLEFYYSP